ARARRSCRGPRGTPCPRATPDLLRSAPRRYISRISDLRKDVLLKTQMPSSLEIAQSAALRPVAEIAAEAGLEADEVELYGRYKAKIDLSVLDRLATRPDAKLIDVTAITPTKAGAGETTTAGSLTQGP